MKTWIVKFESFNGASRYYYENVSGRNEKEARKNATKLVIRHDDRDVIVEVKEDHSVSGWIQ
ncbi:hypothetical protein [Paenibacillus sp. DRB1-1]|uniref:hypothetical protein n=1 Tax=Paenibacillus sp. DRB1-1 TaxID=3422309 RepID=UPI003F971D4A